MELSPRAVRMRTLQTVAFLLTMSSSGFASGTAAQAVQLANDSVRLSFINTDMRAVIQSIGRLLAKPVLLEPLGEVRVELFETPVPIDRAELPEILRGLVEANGLLFGEDSTFYRVSLREAPSDVAAPDPENLPGPTTYRLHVVRLRHARAADVAATLNQLYGTGYDFSRPAGLSAGRLSDELRADREGRRSGEVSAPVEGGALLRAEVTIVPDALTNALLIRATAEDFQVLQEGISQLDVRPLQVLIEVVVVEARKDRQFALGFDVDLPPRPVAGGTIEGSLVGGGLGDLVVRVMALGRAEVNAALSAARLRGDVDILSRPVLLASNNTEAHLLVGTQQPFVQVSRSLPTDTPQRDQVVQYQDVGTKLTVLPTINQDGYVSLLIQQEISAATGEIQFNAPVISSRETSTKVLVANRQTIVIGGLRDRIIDEVRSGIPLLVDIPVIGGLFGSTRSRSTETELFLFITPTIISNDLEIAAETRDRLPAALSKQGFLGGRRIVVPALPSCIVGSPGCGS